MKLLQNLFDGMKPNFEKGGKWEKFHTLYEGHRTIAFAPDLITKSKGAQIKDATDLKRVMITVVIAMIPALLFGILNIGHQHFIATGAEGTFLDKAIFGALSVLPILIVSYAVGLLTEFTFCVIRNHPISEGYLVTGMLIALVMPPFIPLWQVALATIFAVVIGKEVFGGMGMNILNVAMTARAFLYFAYPAQISGDLVWTYLGDKAAVDGFSGATALAVAYNSSIDGTPVVEALTSHNAAIGADYSFMSMFMGWIPGSIGETSTLMALMSMHPPMVEPGPTGVSRPGTSIMASPAGAPVSRTMSAKSCSLRPSRRWLRLASLWALEMMATTFTPRRLNSSAISMGTRLQPDEEATKAVSLGERS